MPNVTITLDKSTLQGARKRAKAERRSLSAQVAIWISQITETTPTPKRRLAKKEGK